MGWTEEDNRQLTKASASTTIHHIPEVLLMDIFEHFDVCSRLRRMQVCAKWERMLNSRQLTTKSIFMDNRFLHAATNLPDKFHYVSGNGNVAHHQATTDNTRIRSSSSLFDYFGGARTLYVRVGPKDLSNPRSPLLAFSQAQRIVFCNCTISEKSLLVCEMRKMGEGADAGLEWVDEKSPRYGLNRPSWANCYLKEISFYRCRIIFQSVTKLKARYKGNVNGLTVRLEKQYKPFDIMCIARDASNHRPDYHACVDQLHRPMLDREKSGDEIQFTALRTHFMLHYVLEVPDDIASKTVAKMDFSKLKHSSLFLLSKFWNFGNNTFGN